MRLVDVDAFERANSAYLDQRACAVSCDVDVMRFGRNHDIRSRVEFVAHSIHRKTERAREYSDVLVVPVPVQRNRSQRVAATPDFPCQTRLLAAHDLGLFGFGRAVDLLNVGVCHLLDVVQGAALFVLADEFVLR